MGERRGLYKFLVEKPKRKKRLGKPRHRWEDNIKMDLQEVDVGAWIGLIWQVAGTCECGNELWCSVKCGEFID